MSSTHALVRTPPSAYGRSKREAATRLLEAGAPGVRVLHCAAIHGDRLSGRLSLIDKLPHRLRTSALGLAKAVKATLSIDNLTSTLVSLAQATPSPASEVILTDGQDSSRTYHWLKRAIDISGSLFLGIVAGWAVALAWIAVRASSPGPGFFVQDRVGHHGTPFRCIKLRTMSADTPNAGSHQIGTASITAVGRTLRTTKLDEVPQIWNVLRGEMSLVGPRPCLTSQLDVIGARKACGLLGMIPGITGLAQIQGVDMSTPERLAATDARYRALQSISGDIKIILATLRGRGFGDATTK